MHSRHPRQGAAREHQRRQDPAIVAAFIALGGVSGVVARGWRARRSRDGLETSRPGAGGPSRARLRCCWATWRILRSGPRRGRSTETHTGRCHPPVRFLSPRLHWRTTRPPRHRSDRPQRLRKVLADPRDHGRPDHRQRGGHRPRPARWTACAPHQGRLRHPGPGPVERPDRSAEPPVLRGSPVGTPAGSTLCSGVGLDMMTPVDVVDLVVIHRPQQGWVRQPKGHYGASVCRSAAGPPPSMCGRSTHRGYQQLVPTRSCPVAAL